MTYLTSNVHGRVFCFRYCSEQGTMFAVHKNGKEYFITAKHVVNNLLNGDSIQVFYNFEEWLSVKVTQVIKSENDYYDVVAMVLERQFVHSNLTIEYGLDGLLWGQSTYFCGFPGGGFTPDKGNIMHGKPIPYAKSGIVSGMGLDNDVPITHIDAVANKGFSGGPVIFKHFKTKKLTIGGVMVSHGYDKSSIIDKHDGESPYKALVYSGISSAHGIDIILKEIEKS